MFDIIKKKQINLNSIQMKNKSNERHIEKQEKVKATVLKINAKLILVLINYVVSKMRKVNLNQM